MNIRNLCLTFGFIWLASCSFKSESSLSTALDLAGNNRHEIQKVLDHYCAPGDSLKRRAAEYLIANMAGKYTVTSPALEDRKSVV